MLLKRYHITGCCIIIITVVVSCALDETGNGKKIAGRYCGTCHLLPDPAELDTDSWNKKVLPAMAEKLGIAYYEGEYFTNVPDSTNAGNTPAKTIAYNDWQKIVSYYTTQSPRKLPGRERNPVQQFTQQFLVKEAVIKDIYPSTTFIKIDPGNRRIYFCNAYDSLFVTLNKDLDELYRQNLHQVGVDMNFENNLAEPGNRTGIFTNIGILYPNDALTGTLEKFSLSNSGQFTLVQNIATGLPRPVQTVSADLNQDGRNELVVCGFGNQSGALLKLQQTDSNRYAQQVLRPYPGAIKTYIQDFDSDSLPDIMTLFAQAQEGIFLFHNKGNGNFETQELLRFPAVYGSTYFELQDMNGDGLKDIVYTCGDNLDFTTGVLKSFHGIYIYINKGNNQFQQAGFFPIHGCYKAMARDFDGDGDMDIAAISYFPDRKNEPQEAFVYLENEGKLNFKPYTIKAFNDGNWVVMDAGDVDGDGDEDIVIGSMLLDINTSATGIASNKTQKPSFLLLLNQTIK